MAKIRIFGDLIQIQSDMTMEEIERVKNFEPEALKLKDEEGNEIFGVGIGDASFSKYGVCFCSEAADGTVFMTTDNPVRDHSDPEAEKLEITRSFAPFINKLIAVEKNVAKVKERIDAMEVSVKEAIEFIN